MVNKSIVNFKNLTAKQIDDLQFKKRSIRLTVQDACLSSRKQGFDSLIEYKKVNKWIANFAIPVNFKN